jgi:ketosteroid isomerase-like protein
MKTSLFFLFVCCFINTNSQTPPNVEPLIKVELAFRDMAKTKNTREAFLHFLADSSVMFREGKTVNGKKLYESNKPDSTLLWWAPDYSDIALSGDFGFNTGHWHFYRKRTDSIPSAIGHFATIWVKQADGNWKAALDIGISYPKPDMEYPLHFSKKPITANRILNADSEKELLDIENRFINLFKKDPLSAYTSNLSSEARILIDGQKPYLNPVEINSYLKNLNNNVQEFHPINILIAPSGDIGCVYGLAKISASKTDVTRNTQVAYIHVWKFENDGWKIVLEVIAK